MMAKMFYTLEETKTNLGKSDDEIKQLTREGRLREFRDGPRLMFKADQVENLKGELDDGGGDRIDLGPSDTGAPIGLVDSRSGSSPVISLADSQGGMPSPGGGGSLKDDTALAADLGLSGSIGLSGSVGGMPSPARPNMGSGSGLSGLSGQSSSGSRGGINVLGDEGADPSAQTAINPAIGEGINMEAMGSGSGLLDLTRESDNTSLGAVLDELPGGTKAGDTGIGGPTISGSAPGLSGISPAASMRTTVSSTRVVTPPVYVEARDSLAPAFGGMALFTALFSLLGLIALGGGVLNVRPGIIDAEMLRDMSFPILAAIGLGVAIVGFVGGLIMGKVRG
ncbi:MAG TPA: hypothetical protein VF624_04035 [Tepidisphaeraceae bacterium]|jgi:hypothetical protein